MNIKKDTLKTMCAVLACSTFLCSLLPAYATTIISESPMDESLDGGSDWTADEGSIKEIEVTYNQSSSYFVTIPKTIALGTNKQAAYSVRVTGDIDTNQRVYVAPVDGISNTENIDFYMKDQTPNSKKADVVATVTQDKLYWNSDDVANGYEEANNSISAPDLTTGTWKGNFQVEIRLETMTEHVHNYVDGVCTGCGEKDPNAEHEHNYIDGKCDCGAIDPDHTHNYENGTCTICGKETDPYEVAPANAINDWTYILDNENNIINLNYYYGSKTDVIVYANYVVNGKTYKTHLRNNTDGTYSTYYMFNGNRVANCKKIKSITFSDSIDTSNLTDIRFMFYMCESLTNINWGGFDTSNVTDMHCMFQQCSSLSDVDLSSFDTSNVTNMSYMFSSCTALTSIDLSNFDIRNVTNMRHMFSGCTVLSSLDLSSFDTSNVADMSYMFKQCTALTDVDLSNFDTSNVTDMSEMFYDCDSLTSLDLSSFDARNATNMSKMFYDCNSLSDVDLSSFDTRNATNMSYMFYNCNSLTSLDLSSFDTRKATNMSEMFSCAKKLINIYVDKDKWVIGSSCNVNYMFRLCGTSEVTYK